jgi:hypothetical protein
VPHLALLCCVADGVHEHEVVVELCGAVLLHHGALQHLADLLRLTLEHGGLHEGWQEGTQRRSGS